MKSNTIQLDILDSRISEHNEDTFENDIIINTLKSDVRSCVLELSETTKQERELDKDYFAPIKYSRIIKNNNYFKKVQKWIGVVEKITNNQFEAKLIDKTNIGSYEMATFDEEEISPSDKDLYSIGAVFYWSVGYISENGQISKKSLLRFKRSIEWDENVLNNIIDKADSLAKNINWA